MAPACDPKQRLPISEARKHPGDTQEAPMRRPGGAQEAPRKHPGGTQGDPRRHPGGAQEAPRRHPGGARAPRRLQEVLGAKMSIRLSQKGFRVLGF